MNLRFNSQSDDWRTEFDLGMKCGGQGKLRRAEKHFSRAIELAPREPYPHYELGYTLTLLKDYKHALRQYLISNELSPAFLQVQTEEFICRQALSKELDHEAVLLIREIQYEIDKGIFEGPQAAELAVTLIQSAPDCPLAYYYLSIAMGDNDIEAHESALRRCLALNPDDSTAIYASARLICLLRNSGRYNEASEICLRTKKFFGDNIHLKNLCKYFAEQETEETPAYQLPINQRANNFRVFADLYRQ